MAWDERAQAGLGQVRWVEIVVQPEKDVNDLQSREDLQRHVASDLVAHFREQQELVASMTWLQRQ